MIFDLGFSDSDLMKMTSILGTPIVSPSLANITTLEVMPSGPDGRASHRYYRTINQYIAELKRNTQLNPKPPEAAKHAQWYEVYTRKMSQVSVLNVDPEVLAFGQATERKFMAIAESLRHSHRARQVAIAEVLLQLRWQHLLGEWLHLLEYSRD